MSITLIVLVAGTAAAAAIDLHRRKIPNPLTLAMSLTAVALRLDDGFVAVLLVFAVMIATFALGATAFSAGWLGGGDVKLLAASCGLASYPGCIWLVLFVLIAGAVLALAQAALQGRLLSVIRNASVLALNGSTSQSPTLVPYGVAIAGGSAAYAIATLFPVIRLPL